MCIVTYTYNVYNDAPVQKHIVYLHLSNNVNTTINMVTHILWAFCCEILTKTVHRQHSFHSLQLILLYMIT